ncbi:MAG: energy transducer TonB [Candidatus Acidiferrales bacterium]
MRPEGQEENAAINSSKPQTNAVLQGFLADCMVDADPNSTSRAGRARGRAIGISALAQAFLLAAILIVPLFATSQLVSVRNAVPIAPYGGMPRRGTEPKPNDTRQRTAERRRVPPTAFVFHAPSNRSTRNDSNTERGTDNLDGPPNVGLPNGDPRGNSDRPGLIQISGFDGPLPPRPEEEKKAATKPIAVSEGAELAQLIHRVEPVYPRLALYRHTEGTVQLRAIIGRDGIVRELHALSGDAVLAYAAQEAVKQWRFRPTMLDGQPIEVDTFITVVFKIKQ